MIDTKFIDTLTSMNIAIFELPQGQKKPAGVSNNAWQKTRPGTVTLKHDSNYGIIVPYGYIVIDVDLYKANAADSWQVLREEYLCSTNTFTCRSARGGLHYWYKLPKMEPGHEQQNKTISPKQPRFLGVDFLTLRNDKASYVVGPGSQTKDGVYEIVFGDILRCAELPLGLYEELVRPHSEVERITLKNYEQLHELIDENFEKDRYIEWLKAQPGLVDGEGRESKAYVLAAEGRDYGLTEQCIFNCMRDFWNDRNAPPLSLATLASKVTNVFKYANDERGNKTSHVELFESFASASRVNRPGYSESAEDPGAARTNSTDERFTFCKPTEQIIDLKTGDIFDWYDDTINGEWDTDTKTGSLKPTSRNLRRLFQQESICDGKYTFRGLIRYDLLSERPVLTKKPFWRQWNDTSALIFGDSDAIAIKFLFANRFNVEFSVAQIFEVILETAKRDPFHPIREWLETLEWDGNKRLEHLFLEYSEVMPYTLNQELVDYRKAIATAFILASIERVFTPGCKWDCMLTLVGPQGTGKSEFVQILGGKYAAVAYSIATDHRTLQALQGGWIVEFPELSSAKKTDVDSIKAFTSTRVDKFIPLHGKSGPQEYPRKSVYVWTLNPPPEGFLRDITGERRFLIIDIPVLIDMDSLREDRDQIFAEAMKLYRDGVTSYGSIQHLFVKTKGMKSQLEKIQEQYKQPEDPWCDILDYYINAREPYTEKTQPTRRLDNGNKYVDIIAVEYEECFEALGLHAASQRGHKEKLRIARAMKYLGYDVSVSKGKRRFEKFK